MYKLINVRKTFRHLLHLVFLILIIIVTALIFLPPKQKSSTETPGFPAQWAWLQRTFPYQRADLDAYPQALRQRKEMLNVLHKGSTVDWEFAGPENISGRITDIEIDPQNPKIIYAGAATGGVFKSEDGGQNWKAVFDDQALLTIGDLAIDPVNPDIVYVGTGEANGGHNNFPGNGLYKSTNAGLSWQNVGLDSTFSIGRVLVDPQNPQRIIVAAVGSYFEPNAQRGIYISEDGGKNWQRSLFVSDSTGAIDLVLDPHNPQFMMAAMWERVRRPVSINETHLYGKTSGIYRTFDGGKNWQFLGPANGLPDAQTEAVGRVGLALYSGLNRVMYALYTDGSLISGLYRSDDDGQNWQETGGRAELRNGGGTFSWYFGQVRVNPHNPDMVYVLDVSMMRSLDGGKTWPLQLGYNGPEYLHVDHHALAFHPHNPDSIYSGNDGGINLSWDGGSSWRTSPPMPITQFYEIGLDRQNPQRIYGGSQDNGTLRTKTSAVNDWQVVWGGDGFYVLVDDHNSSVIYAEYQFGALYKSINDGIEFNYVVNAEMEQEPRNWSTPVVMDPQNSEVLYYGTNRIWRSTNGAQSWTPLSPDLTRGLEDSRVGTVSTIAIAPADSQVIYAGTADGQVWLSQNYGTDWANISDMLPFRWVTRVAVDPQNAAIVYVTYSGLKWGEAQAHIFRSTDYGQNWQDISAGLPDAPVNAIAIDPIIPELLFVGTDVGAFLSLNSGQSWEIAGSGLPAVVVNDLKIHPANRSLLAGTHGRSIYRLDINKLTGLEEQTAAPQKFLLEQNYPNPFNPVTKINYRIPISGHVLLLVCNVLGQRVKTLVDKRQAAGSYSVRFDGNAFPSGVYMYRLVVGNRQTFSRKMILIR